MLTQDQINNLLAWADDLESGRYRQVQGTLSARPFSPRLQRQVNVGWGYCCLGVMCDRHKDLGSWHKYQMDNDMPERAWVGPEDIEHDSEPPSEILNLYGLVQECDGLVDYWSGGDLGNREAFLKFGAIRYLINLNDNGASFKDIAVIVREYAANGGPKRD